MRVAIVGGTGDFGLALARRLVEAGDEVVVGSRDAERAREEADQGGAAGGAANGEGVRGVGLVGLAPKAEGAISTATALAEALGATPARRRPAAGRECARANDGSDRQPQQALQGPRRHPRHRAPVTQVVEIQDPAERSRIAEAVLRDLSDWFGIEESTRRYIEDAAA